MVQSKRESLGTETPPTWAMRSSVHAVAHHTFSVRLARVKPCGGSGYMVVCVLSRKTYAQT